MNTKMRREIHVAALYLYVRFLAGEALQYGMCHYLTESDHSRLSMLWVLFPQWPHFSGYARFPIADPLGWRAAGEIYFIKAGEESLWDQRTQYGRMRLDLLKFIIEQTGD